MAKRQLKLTLVALVALLWIAVFMLPTLLIIPVTVALTGPIFVTVYGLIKRG